MSNLKPIPPFTHNNALHPPSIPPLPKAKKKKQNKTKQKTKKKKTQVISVGVNPQRPNMVIRPPCYASHEH